MTDNSSPDNSSPDNLSRTIRRQTIRRMDNSSHGQFVAGQFVARICYTGFDFDIDSRDDKIMIFRTKGWRGCDFITFSYNSKMTKDGELEPRDGESHLSPSPK